MQGSLINRLSEAGEKPWAVGDGATILMWSDRHAATVIEASARKVTVQEDTSTRTDSHGMSDAQSYEFSPNPNGMTRTYTLRKNGRWVAEGSGMHSGESLGRGRSTYHDYSF